MPARSCDDCTPSPDVPCCCAETPAGSFYCPDHAHARALLAAMDDPLACPDCGHDPDAHDQRASDGECWTCNDAAQVGQYAPCAVPEEPAQLGADHDPTDPIRTIDTATLRQWRDRAYRESARSWRELASWPARDRRTRAILRAAAESADTYHRHLAAEIDRREATR